MKTMMPCRVSVLFAVSLISLFLAQPSSALVVSELMYHPVEVAGNETLEYIELYNDKGTSEDLSKFSFTSGITYAFPADTILGAKQYLVVARDPDAVKAAYGLMTVFGPFTGRFNNDGEKIEISNPNGGIVLSFDYGVTHPWPVSANGAGHSLILIRQGGDPSDAASWTVSSNIGGNPGVADALQKDPEGAKQVTLVDIGTAGRYFKGTREPSPGAGGIATIDWTKINFNDDPSTTSWLDGDNGYGYSTNDAELACIRTNVTRVGMEFNYQSIYIRIRFTLTAEQVASFSQLTSEVRYDDDYVLYLNGTRVSSSNQIVGNPPVYNWGRSSGWEPPVDNLDLTGQMNLLTPGTNVLSMQIHNNKGGSSDAYGCLVLKAVEKAVDPGNSLGARLVINELLANSDAAPGVDWIELYNPGPVDVDLSTVYLSDDRMNLLQYKLPDGIVLKPGEFYSVQQGVPPAGVPFALDFSGETVFVTAATNDPQPTAIRVLDAVRYPVCPPEVTYGRYPDGAPYLGFLRSATENTANDIPLLNDIVINEIMFQHATHDDRYEYIELYNRSDNPIVLANWAFTEGFTYTFPAGATIGGKSYLVVAKDPTFLATVYPNLVAGSNLFGPYTGTLSNGGERIRLFYPIQQLNPVTGLMQAYPVLADEVSYHDGGRWGKWTDGEGASLELRDPDSNNDAPDAWADSDESGKSGWQSFEFTIDGGDLKYTHDAVSLFDIIMLNRAEILLDDLEMIIDGSNRLTNNGFESGETSWTILGNHTRSFVTTEAAFSGSRSLHLISTGHGDPGANRINQSISSVIAGQVTFRGKAKWLRGSRYLLLRVSQPLSAVQPPRPSKAFELAVPMNLGTPGLQNTAYTANRGPDILDVRHSPTLPADSEPIVVTARVTDNTGVAWAMLLYRSEGTAGFSSANMFDNGVNGDIVAGDGIYTAQIPGAPAGTMRAFYIVASDGVASTRFPTAMEPSADVPDRTCLVRVSDTPVASPFATYRVWMSNGVISAFQNRPNLSNELMDCTFVYNNKDVFYNASFRRRGSPFLRSGYGADPRSRIGMRIDFNPDQNFRGREEINLDDAKGDPLQERASYWFYKQMGMPYSMQDFIRLVLNGNNYAGYEDVQEIDTDYISRWFPDDDQGYLHKIDDYFEYTADGTGFTNWDEGLRSDAAHPRLPETYRWNFEKRGHREDDQWTPLYDFAAGMNFPSSDPAYEQTIEQYIHPEQLARVVAIRHAVGDWDSYGYSRSKNNYFYYAATEGKWYLLPWDIDFTMGSGDGAGANIFAIGGQFPEVYQFLNYPKYRRMYLLAFSELVSGPWKTSIGTADPPTAFDRYIDDAANAMNADGQGFGRLDGIKQYVRDRRTAILSQIPSLGFRITTNDGNDLCTSVSPVVIRGDASLDVAGVAVNGTPVTVTFTGNNSFEISVEVAMGANTLNLQGLNSVGEPVETATDSIVVTRIVPTLVSGAVPGAVCNSGPADLTIVGSGFQPGSATSVALTSKSEEIGFNALYVQYDRSFDRIEAATSLLDNPGSYSQIQTVHPYINLFTNGEDGVFVPSDLFAAPYNVPDPDNYAIRFSGYLYVPSAGPRYFGVNSDDGFGLWINGQLVGQYAVGRGPATTDVVTPGTAGTMIYNFPAAGTYSLVLDYFENTGGEEIEFFQTDSSGGNRRLINVDSELTVYRDAVQRIAATNVTVVDENTITCRADVTGAAPGAWNVIVTPECGDAAKGTLEGGLQIVASQAGTVGWMATPEAQMVLRGRKGGSLSPSEVEYTISNTGTAAIEWSAVKGVNADWIEFHTATTGTLAAGKTTKVNIGLNANTQALEPGSYSCPVVFSIGCNASGSSAYTRQIQLVLSRQTDFDRNGTVDLLDWAAFAQQWMVPCPDQGHCNAADFDHSGIVDLGDLVIFAEDWLQP
jgi:hypothetical protein